MKPDSQILWPNTYKVYSNCIVISQGYLLLILQSHFRKLQPQPCGESTCVHGGKAVLLYTSVYLMALGAGGIRGCIPALGADQLEQDDPKQSSKNISSFFNWFLFSITIGASIGVTVVVWVSTNVGWDKGFIISIVCCFVGLCIVSMGKPFYRVRVPGDSPLLSVLQVRNVLLYILSPLNLCDNSLTGHAT